jgi:PAS domain S-box-containing protein
MIRQSVCKKKNEILLYRTKQNLTAILETMIDGMVIADVNGSILSVNKTTVKTMDMEDECGLLGTNVFDHTLDEDKGWLREEFVKTFHGKQTPMRPFRSVTPDGKVMWMEAISTKMRYEGQDAVLIVFRDISQRMAAEERLRLSEERYSSIVDLQTEMICRFLPNMDVTFMNQSFVNTFKQVFDGEVRNLGELASPSEREVLRQFLRSFTPEDRMKVFTCPFPLMDGTEGVAEWNVNALFDAEGVPVEYQAVGRVKVVVKRAVSRN